MGASVWDQYFDDAGVPYFFNTITGESTYDAPASRPQSPPADEHHERAWIQQQDDNGDWYWYNTLTGAAQYEEPPNVNQVQHYDRTQHYDDQQLVHYDDYGQAVDPYYADDADQRPDWSQHQDEAGNWYWYNAATGESTYDQPA